RPTILQNQYIEVPLFEAAAAETAAASAKAMYIGAAYGATDGLKSGDYVVAGIDGNFKKFDSVENDFSQVVGQVLNVTRQLPPSGLLQYYTGLQASELDEYLKAAGNIPGAANSIKP